MKIGIIGSGNVGGALAQTFLKSGHDIRVGVRTPLSQKSEALAGKIGTDKLTSVETMSEWSDVIIITTPPDSAVNLIQQLGNVRDKLLIDATNSVRVKPEPYTSVFQAIKAITGSEKVVKCFNTTGFENMLYPGENKLGIDVFCSGNDAASKTIVKKLCLESGFSNCFDFGGDDKVQLQESLAMCWINLAIMQGHGRQIVLKIVQ